MRTERKIIYLLAGILLGILVGTAMLGREVSAHSQNVKTAAGRLIERYPETGVLPSVGLGIFIGESGGGHNNGRYYGIVASRRYPRTWDVERSTDQFLNVMKRYGNIDEQKTWLGQLHAIQRHGYYGGSAGTYIGYVSRIIKREKFVEFDKKARKRFRRIERRKNQKQCFILVYDPDLRPWEVVMSREVVRGGTVRLDSDTQWQWLDVVKTKRGKNNVIYTGNLEQVMMDPVVKLHDVCEEAVG